MKQKYISDIGNFLRARRIQYGNTLHEVSRATDIDSPLISKIERGQRLPTLDQVKKFARYYKVSEKDMTIKITAARIIREYGFTDATYDAVTLVKEQIVLYKKKKEQ